MAVVGIRADGNRIIGTGHVMRCLSVADEIKGLGNRVVFFSSDEEMAKTIIGRGFELVTLESPWQEPYKELPVFKDRLKELGVDVLLIDSYYVTPEYLSALKKITLTAYIDDLYMFDYDVNLLINYFVYADQKRYKNIEKIRSCIGPSYAPLRKQFMNTGIKPKPNDNILILSGGTDPYGITKSLPEAFINDSFFSKYTITVVCGVFNATHFSAFDERIKILSNVSDMAEVMKTAKFAVSAGGTTLYELCACGVPSISYSFVDNQIENVSKFNELGIIPYAGDLRTDYNNVLKKVINCIKTIDDLSYEKTAAKMRDLIDGNGAYRIAKAVVSLADSKLCEEVIS